MAFKERSTTLLGFALQISVSLCLCVFASLPLPQLSQMTWTESSEAECPVQEKEESFGEELVVASSARRREQKQFRVGSPSQRLSKWLRQAISCGRRPLATNGHQIANGHRLANGLHAPLLI